MAPGKPGSNNGRATDEILFVWCGRQHSLRIKDWGMRCFFAERKNPWNRIKAKEKTRNNPNAGLCDEEVFVRFGMPRPIVMKASDCLDSDMG